ncbi:TadA family conjugal transfer-associated ATPase [Schaalia sp. Marseille-Q2122]|uniref:TadA family conjugal transfer-associated ATPase n=1 Tax=Schaalia sp. Marseille-Q2122 TaxID=2736604 RepID=UPI0020CA550B|nr:TadA family conjugal transfer-associated ATPase [Schaalia sp. Marseille-Q2122]
MTATLIYAHALDAAQERQLNTRLRALGRPDMRPAQEASPPGILFLGTPQAAPWRQRGHRVITVGPACAYSCDEATALLPQLIGGRVQEEFSFGDLIDPLLVDPAVSDVLVNGCRVWVDRGCGLKEGERHFESCQEVRQLAVRIAAYCGRRLDEASPIVDAALPTGIRLHAVLPPVAGEGPLISLRIPHGSVLGIGDMCVGGSADLLKRWMRAAIDRRLNCVISGATGSGKTTLLSAVLSAIPGDQRLVCIEEISELRPAHPHVVHLQERAPNVQGAGGVSLSELVRAAVRMRPDRIIVGECRGSEVRDMLAALNTGHDGGWATIHANSVGDVPARLEALGALAGLSAQAVAAQARAAFDLVIHMERGPDGRRRIAELGVMGEGEGPLRCEIAVLIDEGGRAHQGPAWERLAAALRLGGRDLEGWGVVQ